jgi:hypothetical protein
VEQTTLRTASAALLTAAALGLPGCAAPSAARLDAGVAVVDVTPPVGYRMSGYFYERLSTGTSDPLHAKALVLRQGKERAALVFCDMIGVPSEVTSAARRGAAEKTGIPAASIVIAATHSHTGPLYFDALRKHFHDLAVSRQGSDPCEKEDYAAGLVSRIVKAIVQADAAARPVRVEAGMVEQTGLSFNRRFHMKDGSVRFNPGPLNPDIVGPAGPIDPQVGIVLVREAGGGRPLAAVVNFALHLDTTGGTLYSADYPFYIEQSLRAEWGQDFVLLFGTGTCGDINHIDVTKRDRPKADLLGKTLAAAVRAKVPALKPVARPALAVRREVVQVPLQRYGAEQIAQAREDIHKVGTNDLEFLKQVEAYKIMSLELRGGGTMPLEVQVLRLDADTAVVCLPGEVFVELGLDIKRASPFANTLVIELSQDSPEYVPTRRAFAEGSYETVNSRIAPGGGEMLVEAAARLLQELGRAAKDP